MHDTSGGHPARTESRDSEILSILHTQTGMLRALLEHVALLAKQLAPTPTEGPSLDELIAELVAVLKEQAENLGRVDGRLMAMATDLPPAVAMAVLRASRNRDLQA